MVDELEGILCYIAYAEGANDISYIKTKQKEFQTQYQDVIKSLRPFVGVSSGVECIVDAYHEFIFLDLSANPDEIAEDADEIVQEHLIYPANEHLIEIDEKM